MDDPLTARSADVKTLHNGRWALLTTAAVAALTTFSQLRAQALQGQAPQGQAPQSQASQAQAQQQLLSANVSKYGLAVVDINAIFKHHARLKATREAFKAETERAQAEMKADRDTITKAEAHRNTFSVGSAEYKRADEEVARMMAEHQLKWSRVRKDFAERDAKIAYQTYQEIGQAVEYYAKRHNIGLVLRFSGEPVDPNRPEDVFRRMQEQVVMQDSIDITMEVLMLLNSRDQSPQQQPPASQALRQPQPGVQQRPR
jgi:Skp family chaperone for outer membrane proteins